MATPERIAEIEAKLARRKNQSGMSENVARIERALTLLKRRQIPLAERRGA